jgi:hypothetical protein
MPTPADPTRSAARGYHCSIIAITVWKNTGYYMLFFLAGLAGIPQELLDAAKIDGAKAMRAAEILEPSVAFVVGAVAVTRPSCSMHQPHRGGRCHEQRRGQGAAGAANEQNAATKGNPAGAVSLTA